MASNSNAKQRFIANDTARVMAQKLDAHPRPRFDPDQTLLMRKDGGCS
jgi:hypothetical protein